MRRRRFPALPNDSWYRVEIVLFERLAASTRPAPRRFSSRTRPARFHSTCLRSTTIRTAPRHTRSTPKRAHSPALPAGDTANRSTLAQPAPSAATDPAERAAKLIADYQSPAGAGVPVRTWQYAPAGAGRRPAAAQQPVSGRVSPRVDSARSRSRSTAADADSGRRSDRHRLAIEGFLGVTRGRYLHMDVRLWFAPRRRHRRAQWLPYSNDVDRLHGIARTTPDAQRRTALPGSSEVWRTRSDRSDASAGRIAR